MNMEQWQNDNDREKPNYIEKKSVPMPLYPP
jgi:hypothetical protein